MPEPASILIVDDQPTTLAALQAALGLEGYLIYTARDGVEALEILKTKEVDLILADIAMPRMNGYELYESVRQDTRWVHIPFIFLTARAMASDIRYGMELGVDDYLTKPFQLEDLRATVSGKLLRSRQRIRMTHPSIPDPEKSKDEIVIDELRLQPEQHRLWVGETEVTLSTKEYILLLHLARHQSQVISLEALCQVTHDLETNKVEAGSLLYPLIRSLRVKLAAQNVDPQKIQSIRGVGYCLV